MPSSKVAYKSSIINQNQGGGNKKMGLYPSETIPASVHLAIKSQKNSLNFLMKIQRASGSNNNNSGGGLDPDTVVSAGGGVNPDTVVSVGGGVDINLGNPIIFFPAPGT